MAVLTARAAPPSLFDRIRSINWLLVLFLLAVAAVSCVLLYSAGGGNFRPWADKQIQRFAVGFFLLLVAALTPLRIWFRLAFPIYFGSVALLVVVEFFGRHGKGAVRWIDLGFVSIQPSEIVKVALVLALARYFQRLRFENVGRIWAVAIPVIMTVVPAGLVLKQPDLGTAAILLAMSGFVLFMAGVRVWMFAVVIVAAVAAAPFAYNKLHDYQKERLLTFLDPERDPLGTGYHIIQSKIAFGSGGVFGKGFLQGTQIRLNFLPEFHTDFVLSVLAEEFGMIGGMVLLALYFGILFTTLAIAVRARTQFARLVSAGMAATLFLHLAINMAMVMGALPVVGVPLPLVSYGGTAMFTLMIGFGIVLSAHIYRQERLGGKLLDDD
ncbi:MAG: rod shape-determining protein RodA [Rhodospirillaceae bacterium]|nr:rod shape-determining protein RodA [Rhodospirillaceae bacterium]